MRIEYTEKSVHDLENIFKYIAHDNVNNAISYISKLKEKIEMLTDFPNIGIECKKKGINEDCRIYIFDKFLIFYTTQEETIRINRIIHQAINYQELF